jgi:hypothetical protein
MSKRIIICDGTGNEVKANSVTNVFKIAELADLRDPATQVLYYGPGVGTLPTPTAGTRLTRWVSKVIGGSALGHGMRSDIGEAYTYLMNTWEKGDRVYVFGFSRGAYTARALCGMLYRIGLMRPGSENMIPYALRAYAREPGADSNLRRPGGFDLMKRFSKALSRSVHDDDHVSFPIEFLGLFDTVKGTGIIGPDITWAHTNDLPNVKRVVHAVSIDENRRPFKQCLVEPVLPVPTAASTNVGLPEFIPTSAAALTGTRGWERSRCAGSSTRRSRRAWSSARVTTIATPSPRTMRSSPRTPTVGPGHWPGIPPASSRWARVCTPASAPVATTRAVTTVLGSPIRRRGRASRSGGARLRDLGRMVIPELLLSACARTDHGLRCTIRLSEMPSTPTRTRYWPSPTG